MSQFARRRAALCVRALAEAGSGLVDRINRLETWLGDAISVVQEADAKPACRRRRDGGGRIVIPVVTDEAAEALMKGEEISHFLAFGGAWLPPPVPKHRARPADESIDDLREMHAEAEARAFLEAFLIPDEELLRVKCEADLRELMDESPLGPEPAYRRWQHFQEHGPERFWGPEPWSAWQHYRVEYVRSALNPVMRVFPRSGQPGLTISWPVARGEKESFRLTLHRDLCALRPIEWELRCAAEAVGSGEDMEYDWDEFEEACRRRRWRR